jgi:hypothetical protein
MATKRRPITRVSRPDELDPAIARFLLDGNRQAAVADRKGRGLGVLVLFIDEELRRLWKRHRTELLAEAARQRIRPWWPTYDARPAPVED